MAELPHKDSLKATVGDFAPFANITSNSTYYDDYVYTHRDLNPVIHFTGTYSLTICPLGNPVINSPHAEALPTLPPLLRLVLHPSTQE
jgi:hypothetical protein